MSADEFPKSAFAPFASGKIAYPNSRDVVTAQPFTYFNTSQSDTDVATCWYQPAGYIHPVSEPLTKCLSQVDPNSVFLDIAQDNNVANCVTISNGETSSDASAQSAIEQDYINCVNTLQCVLQSAASLPNASYAPVPPNISGKMQAPASVVPLIIPSQMAMSDNLPPRKVYYHKRHHPSSKVVSNFEVSSSELKNKTRFSATGASGKSTVVRDCKMSLSSSPPSPSAGSVGGSLCSSISRSHFKPIPSPCPVHLSMRNSATASSYSPTKNSASPTSSSVSPRLSTSSSSGVSSRKRRADDESGHSYRISAYSSTSDVIAGVGHVRLSTGSVSPVDAAARAPDRISQQPHKRSKNDNDEDDDVIFVSMEAGTSKPKTNLSFAPSQSVTPFKAVAPVQTVQSARKSKRDASKAANRNKSPLSLVIPQSTYPIQTMPQYSLILGSTPFPSTSSAAVVSSGNAPRSKGYFLRSTVNLKKDPSEGEKVFRSNPVLNSSSQPDDTRYFTRSHQKRKQETTPISSKAAETRKIQNCVPKSIPVSQPPAINVTDKSVSVHAPNSYDPSDASRLILLNDGRQHNTSFSKIYEIKGKIGVGGGGVVYAGML